MSTPSPFLRGPVQAARRAVAWGKTVRRDWRERDLLKLRGGVEDRLAAMVRDTAAPRMATRVLVDGMFDNPGYWYRMNVFRAALGLHQAEVVGLTGPHRAASSRKTLSRCGIGEVLAFDALAGDARATRAEARRLAGLVKRPEDVLDLRLPHDLPASVLYDAILKRQRSAAVDVADPALEGDIHDCLSAIQAAERVLARVDPDVVCLSHAINHRYAALAWLSAKAGRQTVVLFGNYGVPRFWRLRQPDDIFNCFDRPTGTDIDALSPGQAARLEAVGREYLALRFEGRSTDIGGSYAFSQARAGGSAAERLAELGWRSDTPVVSVYASNWFDFPHACGMSHFRDFLDWIQATLRVAEGKADVNWLFKPHPCDQWYGGLTLKDLMPRSLPPHIRLVPDHWSGTDTMALTTGVVTYHGTSALEYAALGKPALVADRGWYHDCGFTVSASSREDYLARLGSDWFRGLDAGRSSSRAAIFAGWYFCAPSWQGDAVLPDDSIQARMYPALLRQLDERRDVVDHEVRSVRAWYLSGEPFYHTYKMRQADEYRLSNIA